MSGKALGRTLAVALAVTAASAAFPAFPLARASSQPNIVVVVVDDQSWSSMRYPTMPYLRSLLRRPGGGWTKFRKAFISTPLCCPSRATILTGQYASHTGVVNNESAANLDERNTVAVWLHDAGYRTGLFGKYLNQYPVEGRGYYTPPGWDDWHAMAMHREGDLYYNYTVIENGRRVTYTSGMGTHSTQLFADRATSFVREATDPFFLYFAPLSPHSPRIAEPQHRGVFASQRIRIPPNFNEGDRSDKPLWVRKLGKKRGDRMRRVQRKELESLLDVDSALEQIFGAIKDRREWRNTVVVYVSDNGMSYGAHRWLGKRCLYEECIHVPMFVRLPGQHAHVSSDLVSNVDIAPTIARLAHVEPTVREDGRSVLPLLSPRPTRWRSELLLEWAGDRFGPPPAYWAIRTPRFTYAHLATGERELYDLAKDPWELSNVAGQPGYTRVQRFLACRLRRLRGLGCSGTT
jgi:arylsulfatase A-like enzyme